VNKKMGGYRKVVKFLGGVCKKRADAWRWRTVCGLKDRHWAMRAGFSMENGDGPNGRNKCPSAGYDGLVGLIRSPESDGHRGSRVWLVYTVGLPYWRGKGYWPDRWRPLAATSLMAVPSTTTAVDNG